ncbi:hypothetical protein QJS10_CPA16g01448 [Acorus calamus]|uniref:Uncharacterized protein n=1 Tax=Acorus calamus TaxID=4465 RepID=A0AAV9D1P6_ACOCL|nr:hypothetical protein QJS10_CPA16g01448 [Acorus calamus]
MENAGVTSETSVRRQDSLVSEQKRSKGLDGSDGDPSKSNQSPNEAEQEASGEDSFEDHADEVAPKAKRKRGAAREAADEPGIDQSLIEEQGMRCLLTGRRKKQGYGMRGKRKAIPHIFNIGKHAALKLVSNIGPTYDHTLDYVIKYNGKLIQSAVKRWVERYERDSKSAMAELLMTLFEACGAKFQLDAGSLDETDVDDVVVSLVNLSKNGDVEDLYSSKRREIKNFKENLVSFWDNLILECQNGPLFDKVLFEKCMDYVIALSCTPPRVYRQVATLLGLQFVTSFITIAKRLSSQRETTQRQLNAEKKKRNDNPRVESLDKRLSSTHEKITLMEEMMRKIFTGLFMHRYRDIDSDIRLSCIKSLGSAGVRRTSIEALQNLYEVDDIVPSLGLFTERFCNRMIELADDIDISVAVSAIGLLKQLLRHQLLHEDELGPLYDLLIDEPPAIRRATGELVYDHLIAQRRSGPQSGSREGVDESSEVHLGRLLQIVEGFSADPILIAYVVDDVWDDMKALKDWKCIISLLLDEKPSIELTDIDTTNLVRFLHASARKAVGEKIVPAIDNRKQYLTKAQKNVLGNFLKRDRKNTGRFVSTACNRTNLPQEEQLEEALENNRGDITAALIKCYPQLLRKYVADKAKVSLLVEMVTILKLELYSLKRQEQNFKIVIQLIKDAFFKHGERDALRSCIKAINFCSNESQADLQDYSQSKLKELEDELINKLKSSMKEVAVGDDEYSLLINLKRLYEVQLTKNVPIDGLFEDMDGILRDLQDTNDESIDVEDSSEEAVSSLLSKRAILFERLEYFLDTLPEAYQGRNGSHLACRVLNVGHVLSIDSLSDETDDEDANEDYIEDTNRDAVMIAAAKLVSGDVVPKDFWKWIGFSVNFFGWGYSTAWVWESLCETTVGGGVSVEKQGDVGQGEAAGARASAAGGGGGGGDNDVCAMLTEKRRRDGEDGRTRKRRKFGSRL